MPSDHSMYHRSIFHQIFQVQFCLCLILVSLPPTCQSTTTPRPVGGTSRPSRITKGVFHNSGFRPWVEPLETCGRIPLIYKRASGRYDPRETTTAEPWKPPLRKRSFLKRPKQMNNIYRFKDLSRSREGVFPSFVMVRQLDGGWNEEEILYEDYYEANITPQNTELMCGGFLVSNNVVITAAHCVENAHHRLVWVTVGLTSIHQHDRKVYLVDKFWFHPDACKMDEKWQNLDFAILILKENITYNDYIQPACFDPLFKFNRSSLIYHVPFPDEHFYYYKPEVSLVQDDYKWPCTNHDKDYKWLRKTHECYENQKRNFICEDHYSSPLYFMNPERDLVEDRFFVGGLGSFRSNGTWYDDCVTNRENGAYFLDFYRSRQFFPWTLEGAVTRTGVNPDYAVRRCFRPKRRINPYNHEADFDHLLDADDHLLDTEHLMYRPPRTRSPRRTPEDPLEDQPKNST